MLWGKRAGVPVLREGQGQECVLQWRLIRNEAANSKHPLRSTRYETPAAKHLLRSAATKRLLRSTATKHSLLHKGCALEDESTYAVPSHGLAKRRRGLEGG